MPAQSAASVTSPNRQNSSHFSAVPPLSATEASRSPFSPVSSPDGLGQWWDIMSRWVPSTKYFDASRVKPNGSGIRCPDNAATVTINRSSASANDGKPIHASKFVIPRRLSASQTPTTSQRTNTYSIGQSPHLDTCEDFLVAGLESKLGLYQFVSESTHNGNKSRTSTPVIQFLENKIKERTDNGLPALQLGSRFVVKGLKAAPQNPVLAGCKQYFLTVIDKTNNNNEITVPISQAGLPFQDAVLTAESIARASAIMDQHLTLVKNSSDAADNDPLILSHAGYGRNATLMTYRNMCMRIADGTVTSDKEIDQQVRQFIEERRQVRPGFVHSLPQVEHLQKALQVELKRHQSASIPRTASAPEPAPTRHARSASPPRIVQLNLVSLPVASAARVTTTCADIAEIPVDGIVVDGTIVTAKEDFKKIVDNTLSNIQPGTSPGFQPIIGPPSWRRDQPPFGSQQGPTHVLAAGIAPKKNNNFVAWLPEKMMKNVSRIVAHAAGAGLKSVAIPTNLLESEPPSSANEPTLPLGHVAALAVAAIDQHAADTAAPIHVTFQCATPAQQVIIDDVITKRNQFKNHQHHQALLRSSIKKPTTVSNDALADFANSNRRASFVPVALNQDHTGCVSFSAETPLPVALPGSTVPFAPWRDVPTTRAEWEKGDVIFAEEKDGKDVEAAGVVIVEDDGRIWVVAPTNGFAEMDNTFPKGQRDGKVSRNDQWSVQATARKEAYEESGLQVELTGFLCDYQGRQKVRYYLARRIGGTPADVGWESQGVHLVPQDQLRSMLTRTNNWRENFVLDVLGVPRNAEAAFTDLDALLRRPNTDYNSTEFEDVAKKTSEIMKYVGTQRRQSDLVQEDQVRSRYRSRQPELSTALVIPGAKAGAPRFLHANRVNLEVGRQYIASQYPLSNANVDNRDDFWRTVVDNRVSLIVDLTRVKEKKYDACYAPDSASSIDLATYELKSSTIKPRKNTSLEIKDATVQLVPRQPTDRAIEVKRMHFTQWEDTTAITVDALIGLAEQVKRSSQNGDTILIHCSRGVGRTGTLITFLAASEKIAAVIERGAPLTVTDFLKIVRDVLIKGREARGEQFVARRQFPLVLRALLQKHFADEIVGGVLRAIALPAGTT